MVDLERRMAEALEGSFFWEHTKNFNEPVCADSLKIVKLQRQFATPKKLGQGRKALISSEKIAKLAEKRSALTADNINDRNEYVKQTIDVIVEAVSETYKVAVSDIVSSSRFLEVMIPRHHIVWGIHRYIPGVSRCDIGRAVGRHHSTVIHSISQFEKLRKSYESQVEAVDKIMGYVPG